MSEQPLNLPVEAVERLHEARLFVLDVDGTLTTGAVVFVGDTESQSFDVHDGQGLVWLKRSGVQLAWISGRGSQPTRRRASELGVEHLVLKCKDKSASLREIQSQLGLSAEQTVSMGDDLPDLALAELSGFFAAPSNARPEVLERADLVTRSPGGKGAVREVCEVILRAKGGWQSIHSAAGR